MASSISIVKESEAMSKPNPAANSQPASPVAQAPEAAPAAQSAASLPPYESDLVCDFFRQIGRLEVARRYEEEVRQTGQSLLETITSSANLEEVQRKANRELRALLGNTGFEQAKPWAAMVGNAQNPLDHLVGDLVGRSTEGRYFIIEFKQKASGFLQEIDLGLGKPDRVALHGHLLLGDTCKELSLRGHYGAYWTPEGIRLQSYFTLITAGHQPLIDVQEFFVNVIQGAGSGWSAEELQQYIECMTAHGVSIEADSGKLVFGYFTPDAKFVEMTSGSNIIAMIQAAFDRAAATQAKKFKPI